LNIFCLPFLNCLRISLCHIFIQIFIWDFIVTSTFEGFVSFFLYEIKEEENCDWRKKSSSLDTKGKKVWKVSYQDWYSEVIKMNFCQWHNRYQNFFLFPILLENFSKFETNRINFSSLELLVWQVGSYHSQMLRCSLTEYKLSSVLCCEGILIWFGEVLILERRTLQSWTYN
jgi:hypothetical protein